MRATKVVQMPQPGKGTIQRVSAQKRLAMELLECGRDKVWLNPQKLLDIKEARTRDDIRKLIADGTIKRKWGPSERSPEYYKAVYDKDKHARHAKRQAAQKRKEKYEARIKANQENRAQKLKELKQARLAAGTESSASIPAPSANTITPKQTLDSLD